MRVRSSLARFQAAVVASSVLRFRREVDYSAPNLHRLIVKWGKGRALLDQNESAEFRVVVLEHELAIFKFDARVAPTDGNIVDAQVALVAAAQLENVFLGRGANDVDNARVVLLLRQTFQHHVVALRFIIFDEAVVPSVGFHHERVGRLADLAFKSAPEVRREVWRLL